MPQFVQTTPQRRASALVAAISSFILLGSLFVATMFHHYHAMDLGYLSFAAVRITAISLAVAAAASLAGRRLRSLAAAALFGAVGGIICGAALVAAAA